MELTEKQRFWKAHIEAAQSFEGTQADYARLHDLDLRKFYFFKASLRDKGALGESSAFVKVTATSARVPARQDAQVLLPNGVRLALPDITAPGVLERLARL
jgi:hypothetical protein